MGRDLVTKGVLPGDGFPLGTAGMTERGTLGFFQRVSSIFPEEQRTGLSWEVANRVSDVGYQGNRRDSLRLGSFVSPLYWAFRLIAVRHKSH